ncbi:ATP-dependent protease La (LON) domain protein [Tasmannia lanceolata]|uniref:ATP-dependent protease La (LON) domain protein n=1 Tax=Tasmannia lanceolata TaxID=3420 RepID=UPI004064451E
MDRERLLENERLQIEQIRALEMEELQIEEVDPDLNHSSSDDSSELGDRGASPYGGFTFNTCLASLHTYLGEVEDTHGRLTFLDGGAILNLPMFYLEGVVLFPEATLPLRVVQPRFKAAVERALNQVDAPCTIGVVRVNSHSNDERFRFSRIGTTAEIRQYRRLEDGSLNVVTRGHQRFRLRRRWIDIEGAPYAEVQIIQEDLPLRTPKDAFGQLASVSNFHNGSFAHAVPSHASRGKRHKYNNEENDSDHMSEASTDSNYSMKDMRMQQSSIGSSYSHESIDESTSSDDEFLSGLGFRLGRSHPDNSEGSREHCISDKMHENDTVGQGTVKECEEWKKVWAADKSKWLRRAPRSFWPHWVYRMYDSYSLAQKAADMWRQIIGVPCMDGLINKPDLLSFYIASKIPLSESTRQELLEIDGISYRLRREIELLERFDLVRCKTCQAVISKRSDTLVMSSDGPLNAYVNPQGYVHEIMTLYNATGLALIGPPVREYSWFPGYAWTITNCANCETQMGWLFTATNKNLRPRSFWGIRSSQVADDLC